MRLHRLTVSAFGPFGATEHIDFDTLSAAGLFLLHGATGAGKTSVLDAVCFALYGAVPGARQSQGAGRLRSDHADPGTATEVVLDVTVGGRRLEVTRRPEQPRRKRSGDGWTTDKAQSLLRAYDPEAGEWRGLSRSHREIGQEITELLGMSREQFCQVVLLPQGDFARFLRAGAEERAQLLGRLFDTGRFAAVERHLAELRAQSQQRLRAADEHLLALAHRMHQAAGDIAAEHPLPPLSAGEPDLTGTVLGWAAVARGTAYERGEITASAAAEAERAHRGAERRLAEARELARLQQRGADAARRAAQLAEAAPERAQVRAHLDRARAADTVQPALDLREQAAAAHRRAARVEEELRARLPTALATATAEELAHQEAQLRERLGALDAARRAEQRSAELAAQLAALEAEAGADEETLREAEQWLADWPARRDAHQARVDAAADAATRAEQLTARLDPASRRLEAARRRDDLAARTETVEHAHLTARERATAAHEEWLDLRERRLQGMAAELAAALRTGEPCAVCGSREHPGPARRGTHHVDRQAEERALAAHREAEDGREAARRTLARHEEALTAATTDADGGETCVLDAEVRALTAERDEARTSAGDAHAAREAMEQALREQAGRLAARDEAGRRAAARAAGREALLTERAALHAEVERARGTAASVSEQASRLQRFAELAARASAAAQQAQDSADRLKQADAQLADAAYRARFSTPQQAAGAVLPPARQRALQERLDDWQAQEGAAAAELADPQVQAATELPPAAPETAERHLALCAARWRAADAAHAAARSRREELVRLSTQAAADARRHAPLRAEADRAAALATLTAGTSAENERRMRLESYVLAARLEQVAAAAGARLAQMSGGRYTLLHSDERAGRGARSGLGLHVVDAWTGQARDTASLSGGETFTASLALALGLADTVSDEAGGTRLDTLFIDEGFGSLDEQTLDEVMDVLDSLRERDRSVGIVSHVAELRRRVPAQLHVVRQRTGSTVRLTGQDA
ncbi:SMC family ATPase [Streptomyces sp. 549]|uniref:SMC family ATPase n=1 Tax=Streptomyces sp. 549 TaxID=3049076 RepID=UPI0024C35ED8|nr:SMC family ATPase [Streptomyces sp. 549]MDK1474533.1 SMC family ATPase [Streptomyces sp. 549]